MLERRKVVLVGTGFVGMSVAYSLLNQGGINELVLIDIMKEKTQGEAMDLSHGMPFAPSKIDIKAGEYEDCKDANIVVITAGLNQKPGQTRLELAQANAKIIKEITNKVVGSGFEGIFVVASNPVDLMTHVVYKASGFPKQKVIGSGTVLDTARLRYLIGEYIQVSSKNVHAYIMGEHGDSSFVPWSHCYIGCKKLLDIMKESNRNLEDLDKIYVDVQQAAYQIIEKKKATYYGIGISLTRLIKAILADENAIMPISTCLEGEYGHEGIFIGVPAIINRNGIKDILELKLEPKDQEKFDNSCNLLKKMLKENIDTVI
ncbi:MAG: L-lactate dehydrogenase [Clostridia bacterium]|jgi:L-lactate dehydrogenase|nr:L-lactate dehydrogenase [Clostridia bacterium]